MVKIKYNLHHFKLLFNGHKGVVLVKSVLLQKSYSYNTGNLNNQLLVVGKNIRAYQLYYFHKIALFRKQGAELFAVFYKVLVNIVPVPVGKVAQILAVRVVPVYGGIMPCVGKTLVKRPETAGKALCVLRNRL